MRIMTSSRHKIVPDGKPMRQRGFSLWELAVLLGLLGVAIVAGFALLKSDRAQQVEKERSAQLSAGDRALAGFVAENGRLPCPDTNADGREDCGASAQKGWLPVVTLGLSASAPARGAARLDYIVYRGAGANLTVLADRYNPVKYDLTTAYTYNQLNTLDFCAGLTLAASAAPGAAAAYIPGASGAAVNVAYALAESGIDSDGDGNLFDGLNASAAAPVLESPARASDLNYDDIVQARSFADLQDAFRCPQATRSVDAISMAVEVGVTVADLKQANYDNGVLQSVNAGILFAMDVASLAITVASAVAGGVVLAEATAALSAAIASCVVLVGCALIPPYTAAVVAAGIGLGFAAGAIAADAVAIPLTIAALAASIIATAKAGAAPPSITPVDPAVRLAELKQAADDAAARATAAEADALAARNAANAAALVYTDKVNYLYSRAHLFDTAGTNDPKLAAALAAYEAYARAAVAYDAANGDAKAKRDKANSASPAAIAAAAAAAAAAYAASPTDANKRAMDMAAAAAAPANAANVLAKWTPLDAAATQAEQDAAAKLATRDNAYASYVTARNTAIAAYAAYLGNHVAADLDSAVNAYSNIQIKERAATTKEAAAATARQTATSMQAAYNQLAAAIASGTTTGGPAVQAFSGAEAILKAADLKGALQ